jgi:TPR repeat protein
MKYFFSPTVFARITIYAAVPFLLANASAGYTQDTTERMLFDMPRYQNLHQIPKAGVAKAQPKSNQEKMQQAIKLLAHHPEDALPQLNILATNAYLPAQALLGELYFTGNHNIPKDFVRAEYYLKAAAYGGSVAAQRTFINFLKQTRPASYKTDKEVLDVANLSLTTTSPLHMAIAGIMYIDAASPLYDPEKGVNLLQKAAAHNLAHAYLVLGMLYLNKSSARPPNIPQDDEKALDLFKKAASAKHKKAYSYLAEIYLSTDTTAYDPVRGAEYAQKAADEGDPFGELLLSHIYSYGLGVTKNSEESKKWYLKSLAHKDVSAFIRIGDLYYNQARFPRDIRKSVHYYTEAARMGNTKAQLRIGQIYMEDHENFPAKPEMARQWLEVAQKNGESAAEAALKILNSRPQR